MKHLNAAIAKTGKGDSITVDDNPPPPWNHCGHVEIWLDADLKIQFAASNACSLLEPYWKDVPGSRGEAIAAIIDKLSSGFEPMSEDTANGQGVDL